MQQQGGLILHLLIFYYCYMFQEMPLLKAVMATSIGYIIVSRPDLIAPIARECYNELRRVSEIYLEYWQNWNGEKTKKPPSMRQRLEKFFWENIALSLSIMLVLIISFLTIFVLFLVRMGVVEWIKSSIDKAKRIWNILFEDEAAEKNPFLYFVQNAPADGWRIMKSTATEGGELTYSFGKEGLRMIDEGLIKINSGINELGERLQKGGPTVTLQVGARTI